MAKFSLLGFLGLNTKAFQTGINHAQKKTNAFAGAWKRLGPLLSAAAFTQLGRSAIRLGSELNDLARQTRTSVEALQVLRHAARETGASNNALERALRNVTTRTEDAIGGNKMLADAFTRLGIDVNEFNRLPTEKRLEALAKAQKNAGDSTRAFTDVARILGERAGPELQGVLDSLARDGFDNLAQSAKDAGQVMSAEAAASMDFLANTGTGLMNRLKVLTATVLHKAIPVFRLLGTIFGPVVDAFNFFQGTLNAVGRLFGTLIHTAINPTVASFRVLAKGAQVAALAIRGDFRGAVRALHEMREEAKKARDEQVSGVKAVIAAHKEFAAEVGDNAKDLFNDIADRSDDMKTEWEDLMNVFSGNSTDAFGNAAHGHAGMTDSIIADNHRIEASIKKLNGVAETFTSMFQKGLQAVLDEEKRLFEQGLVDQELKALEARARGESDVADEIEEQIKLQEQALKIAQRHNIAYADALDLVTKIADAENNRAGGQDALAKMLEDVPASRQGEAIRRAANELGKETGTRFERVAGRDGETRFRKLVDGRAQRGTLSESEMRDMLADQLDESQEVDLLEEIRDSLKGRFVNE